MKRSREIPLYSLLSSHYQNRSKFHGIDDIIIKKGSAFVVKIGDPADNKYMVVNRKSKKQSHDSGTRINIIDPRDREVYMEVAKLLNQMVHYVTLKDSVDENINLIEECVRFQRECFDIDFVRQQKILKKKKKRKRYAEPIRSLGSSSETKSEFPLEWDPIVTQKFVKKSKPGYTSYPSYDCNNEYLNDRISEIHQYQTETIRREKRDRSQRKLERMAKKN